MRGRLFKKNKSNRTWTSFIETCFFSVLILGLMATSGCANNSVESNVKTEELLNEIGYEIEFSSDDGDAELDAPYGVRITKTTNSGTEFYWKEPEAMNGYEVYRSYEEEGIYVKIANCPDRENNTENYYTDNEFDHAKRTVFYRARSYRIDENNNVCYSQLSKQATAVYKENLELNHKVMYEHSGDTRQLEAYFGWGNADDALWSSSDESVASVAKDGSVTGISQGKATITCSSDKLGESITCEAVIDRPAGAHLDDYPHVFKQTSESEWTNGGDSGKALLMLCGDLMCTSKMQGAAVLENGEYNFNYCFDQIQPVLSQADLRLGNLEGTLSPAWPYMSEETYIDNEPNCNGPTQYLDAVCHAGFDVVTMANNHCADAGIKGTEETIDAVDDYGLAHTGLFKTKNEKRYLIMNVNGIKVGFLAYNSPNATFNEKEKDWPEKEVDIRLNSYSKERASNDIEDLRSAGAEYVIVYMHWGEKNNLNINEHQERESRELANMDVDYIIGAHPHVLQKYTVLTADDGRKVPCFYSLGDFLGSVDQIECNRDTLILQLQLEKDESGDIVLAKNTYIPCRTVASYNGKAWVTIPLDENFVDEVTGEGYQQVHDRIIQQVGTEIEENK